ncbi:hypothetical protein GCM10008018_62290 [Paenibacillus marchantiophytorum]|uniref:Uncharacterized protein n=1 Tax=Paenibacillus marchantiophytorum TaxID=1619310 RepID=A0ABQ1FE15_9BACL|nr:hypothetical protein [Paenibacillus marchantiophytorum]GGA08191.1 hypothetical protein GCM10008018_62290 [Paenibacillus marchantiophytorum]
MMHTKIVVEGKEVLVFFEPNYQGYIHVVAETIIKHLANAQVKKIFDDLGLVNITSQEVTLYSLDGEMETLCIS